MLYIVKKQTLPTANREIYVHLLFQHENNRYKFSPFVDLNKTQIIEPNDSELTFVMAKLNILWQIYVQSHHMWVTNISNI